MTPPVAGLFGKLPAYGDFLRRGWPDETVDAVDRWLTDGVAAARAIREDDDFAAWMHAAPLWHGYVPPGMLGPLALHLALAPSIDKAGRLFPIALGVAGDAGVVWAQAGCGLDAILDAAIYDALAGRIDVDGLIARIEQAIVTVAADRPPDVARWWPDAPAAGTAIAAGRVDAALIERLFSVGERVGVPG